MTNTDTDTDRDHETETDAETDSETMTATRRALLAAGAGGLVGSVAAGGLAQQADADAQGGLGTPTDPVAAAYLTALRGPISDQGGDITSLVNMRAAEDSATISVDPNTLVFRYDPTTTL